MVSYLLSYRSLHEELKRSENTGVNLGWRNFNKEIEFEWNFKIGGIQIGWEERKGQALYVVFNTESCF